jgi:hypothetical protein
MKNCSFLFFILLHFHITAQENLVDKLHALQQNPTLKEKVYIHTNKASYFTDDTIWFKAYVGDTIKFPSIETTKLYVNLLDDQGTPIYSKNIFIRDGMGSGEFELNDAVMPGRYYIQAYTNFMRNFGDDNHYLQEVWVVGENPVTRSTINATNYDIQLFPEGGYLLEGTQNTIGIKALVNGKEIDFSGNIANDEGKSITTFKNQHLGMAKFEFIYEVGKTHTANISINDTLVNIKVPKALEKGVSLQVDNSDKTYLEVTIKTNEATFLDQMPSNYTLLYHQDRQIFDLISINRMDSLSGSIKTKKDIFPSGVNTVTLFKDDKPIAERKFFVENEPKRTDVTIEEVGFENDSLKYKIRVHNKNRPLKGEISLSILPANSNALEEKQNIRTAFLLTPFLRGHIENPAYYFNLDNPNRKEHLDLLLLTQGWALYTLDELIQEINPDEKYKFEDGFELKGTLQEEANYDNLVLIPDDLRIIDTVAIKDRSRFVFQNLHIFKGDTVRVAYQDGSGKIIKPSNIEYDTTYNKNISNLTVPRGLGIPAGNKNTIYFPERFENHTGKKNTTPVLEKAKKTEAKQTGSNTPLRNLDGTIDLDEVIVTEKKLSERYLQRRKVIEKYKPIVSDIGKYYDISIPEVVKNYNSSLRDFIASKGFSLKTHENGQYYLGSVGSNDKHLVIAPLFINGRRIQPAELPTLHLGIEDIENIMVNNLGYKRTGVDSSITISIFQIFTSDVFGQNKNELFDKFVIKNGFDQGKNYYSPRYISDQSRPIDLLEVDWKPNLKTDKKGEISFKIAKDNEMDGLLFLIQGFSNEGHLISETIKQE